MNAVLCPCWAERFFAGLALIVAAVVLTWPAGARPQDESAKVRPGTVTDDLKLVPPDTSAFVTMRVADLMKSEVVKKHLFGERKEPRVNLAAMEKAIGMPAADIDRLTVLDPLGRRERAVIVRTSRDYDPQRVLGPKVKQRVVGNHTVYDRPGTGGTVYLAGRRVLVVGSPQRVSEVLNARAKKTNPLKEALKRAEGKHHYVVGVQPYLIPQVMRINPWEPAFLPYMPLMEARTLVAMIDATTEVDLKVELSYDDEETALDSVTAARTALYVARHLLARLPDEFRLTPEAAKSLGELVKRTEQTLKTARIEREKTTVRASLRLKAGYDLLGAMVNILQQHAAQQQVIANLHNLSLAAQNFANNYKDRMLFGPAIYSKDGKPLLSWRVILLPYIEQQELYDQFKFDEPWDSPHNKKLLEKMPAVYAPLSGKSSKPYTTYLRVFTGPQTPFDPQKAKRGLPGLGGASIPDSFPNDPSNTILIVEAAEAVPWTKPDELVYDPKKPLPKLGGQFPGHIAVITASGRVRLIRNMVSEKTLRTVINPADENPLGPDW
jgi:hypothetical protein